MADDVIKSTKATKEATGQVKSLTDAVSEASQVLVDLAKNLRAASESIPKDEVKSLTIELSEMSIELEDAKTSTEKLTESGEKSKKSFSSFKDLWKHFSSEMTDKYPIAIGATVGAMSGLAQGFRNVVAVSKSLIGLFSSIADTAINVGLAILSIPIKILDTLIDMAESGAGGNEIARAYEAVRKEFGAFRSEAAKTTIELSKTFKGFNETGLSTWRVFGNIAERLEYAMELVKGFGMTLGAFTKEFEDHGGRLAAYQKGLGLTAEEFRSLGSLAISTGRQLQDVSLEITKYTLQFSGGVIDKRFSRQIQKAIADVAHFGGATVKEIARAAAYAKGLHIELEKIVGILDAFETFDEAAENAAKLSQSFGMVVDTFKMVNAQSPDEQLDMLRKSFLATGKSAETFTRQELKLLAQTTHLSEDVARQVFSQKNLGKSLSDVQKEADKAKNSEMTQAQAMSKLADAIERLIKDGELMKGGFFEQFFKGFVRGLQWTSEFWKLMMNLRLSLREAFFEGIKFGQWFAKNFPGWTKMISALGDMFNPKKIREFFAGFSEILKGGIEDLKSGKFSLPKLMENLKKHFFDFFSNESGPGKKFLEGAKEMFQSLVTIASQGVRWLSSKIVEGLKLVKDILSGKIKLSEYVTKGAASGNVFLQMLMPLWDALKDSWRPLLDALKELMAEAWKQLKKFATSPEFLKVAKPVVTAALVMMFAPSILQGALGAVSGQLSTFFVKAMTGGLAKSSASIASQTGPAVTKSMGSLGTIGGVAAAGAAIVAVTVGLSRGMSKFKSQIDDEFSDSQKTVAAGAAGVIDAITFGMTPTPVLVAIGNMFAKMTKSFEDNFNKLGGSIGTSYVKLISANVKMLSGVGDVLIGLFTGDSEKISDGIKSIVFGFAETFVRGIISMVTMIPTLVTKLVIQPIFNMVGNVLQALGAEAVGKMVKDIGSFVGDTVSFIVSCANKLADAIGYVVNLTELFASKQKKAATASSASAVATKAAAEELEKAKKEFEAPSSPVDLSAAFKSIDVSKESSIQLSSSAFRQIDDLEKSLKSVTKERVKSVKDGLASVLGPDGILTSLAKDVEAYRPQLESATKSLKDEGVQVAMSAVSNIVKSANEMNAALADGNINKLDVKAKLQRVANAVGLKNQKYTIDNKDVQITLNLTVVMEAGEVEKVIVQRKASVIRDRLNHVQGGYDKSNIVEHSIPNTPEQPVQMIGGGE